METKSILDILVHKLVLLTQEAKSPLSVTLGTQAPADTEGRTAVVNFTSNVFEREPGEFRILQPIWDLRVGHDRWVESPLFPIILSVSFYFLCMLPFTIMDLFGRNVKCIQKYKIQPDRVVTWPVGTTR